MQFYFSEKIELHSMQFCFLEKKLNRTQSVPV